MNLRSFSLFTLILAISLPALAQEEEQSGNPFKQIKQERVVVGWDTFELAAAEFTNQRNSEARFKHALSMVIEQLASAETSSAKKTLLGYAREALTERYTEQIELRRKEISRLEMRLKELKEDLAKRSARAEQVVNLQINSLELASEGLIDRDQVLKLGGAKSAPTAVAGVRNVVKGYPLSAEPVEVSNVKAAAVSEGR